MSTKLTIRRGPVDAGKPLTVLLEATSQFILQSLIARLQERGYDNVTEPHLVLFGNLDCGATHAAQIAQRMQMSRQAISKTLRELQSLGLVRLEDDPERRNQKTVVMTPRGMQLARAARDQLRVIETEIAAEIGSAEVAALRSALEKCWEAISRRRLD